MSGSSKTADQAKTALANATKSSVPNSPVHSSTVDSPTNPTQTVTAMEAEHSHRVADHNSAAVKQSGFAETMQHILVALRANLKLHDKSLSFAATAPSSADEASQISTSRFKWKKIHEV